MTPNQLALLVDTTLALEARVIGLYLSEHQRGWAELRFQELGKLIGKKSDAVRNHLRCLIASRWVERRPGGRGRGDLFRFHEELRVGAGSQTTLEIGAGPDPTLSQDRVTPGPQANGSSPHSHLGWGPPNLEQSRVREEVLTSTPEPTTTPPRTPFDAEVLPSEERSASQEVLGRPAVDFFVPEIGSDHVQPNVILSKWLDHFGLSRQLSAADRGKQAAAAKRLSNRYGAAHLAAAFIGMSQLFQFKSGWDLLDLERQFTKALLAAQQHPDLQRQRREQELRKDLGL